ncbi:hypothetical protein [Desulfovibrio oxyclinae]|uniref:hypothetical protein n=1 Tax=Desulfovibrio oxyclinae TaxID=63560 RepID=UPI0003657E6B|nr:hypothetical protein [Desulfovibrio oxyclinae]
MKKLTPKAAYRKLAALYKRMADEYSDVAGAVGLSCEGCNDNCCRSYFQHHTYVEWAYLWEGLNSLPGAEREAIRQRAETYLDEARIALEKGERPAAMCPLIREDGLCGLYEYRLMTCRMHGVPNVLVRPDGRVSSFPGCWRTQELAGDQPEQLPTLNRTPMLKELAQLEMQFVGKKLQQMPKVDHTIAEMILIGPPKFS